MNLYTKFHKDIILNHLAQIDNLLARCSTTIDQYKRLLVVHTCSPEVLTFPTALVDEPSCRNLLMLGINGIMRHRRI